MKMNNEKVQEAFAQLRPLCVTLTKEHTIENVKLVQNCLVNTDADTFQGLQEYILFPLRLILKQSAKSDENLYEQVVCCMCFILERTEVQGSSMFLDIFNTLCLLVTRTSTPGQVSSVSEELKLAVIKSLSALLKSAATQTLEEVYQPSFLPALGHVVTLMIQMVDRETNRDLRVASLACLMDVSLVNRKTSGMLTRSLSNLFASFVPGVSMGLCKVITGDTKQGQKITVTAIEAWHKIISLVMSDQNNKAPKTSSENKKSDNKEISSKYAELVVTKSEEWVKNTADKLKILIQKINEVKSHSNWRVRMAMVEWSSSLLMNCSKSLESCIPDFLEVLVSLVGDDYPNVASKSRESLKKFTTSESSHTKTLTEILEDNLHTMATQLPRLIRTADEETKLSTIKLFNGYIQLLGASVNKMLSSSAHLQRVSLALLQVLELDCSSVTIIQEKTQGESFSTLELGHLYNSPKKCFKLFTDSNIYTCLMTTCRMLGYYGDPDVLFDHFIDLFHQYKIHRKQSILVLCHLCEGILQLDTTLTGLPKHHCDKAEVEPLIRSLLDIFLSPEHLDLPTTLRSSDHNKGIFLPDNHGLDLQIVSSKAPMSSSLLEVNSNVLQICLLLEAIGICIQVLGKDYEYLMMDVLYPVLEKIGSENTAVSQTAYITLSSVARSCQYSCIEDLLRANADYLVNCLSLRMRHLDRNPQAPQVLSVILQHSGERILPLVEDTIRDVMEGLDSYYEEVGLMFMKVLHTLTLCIKKWYPPTSQDSKVEDKASSSGKPVKTAEDIKLYLLGYLHQKKIAEGIDTDADEDLNITTEADKEAEDIEDFDDTKVEPPYHVQKLKQVLERCVHQMSAPDPRVRLVTMETVIQGLLALKPHETELLPLVHKLWAPFTQRLRDEEMVVILKACSVLQIFAEVSKDFIRQRLIKDVFPKLTDFLNKQASISLKAGPVYHHSMACKLQGRILQDLGQLCRHVGVGENHLTKVITATLPYLSCRQPGLLQNACVTTLQQLCELEPDTVWLLLNELYCDLTPTPPHPHFPLVQGSVLVTSEELILEVITSKMALFQTFEIMKELYTVEERCALIQDVVPSLREYCRQRYGLEFQLFDPRWASNEDWDDWNTDRQLCLQEVLQCKRDSAGPTFVTLLGQRYGCRPVPASIAVPDFEAIRVALQGHWNRDTRDATLLDVWYMKDTNIIPPVYRLVPKDTGLAGQRQYYEKNSLILGRDDMNPGWVETRLCLKRLVTKGVEYCLIDGTLTDDVAAWYISSDLEKEIDLGILRSFDSDKYCMVICRDIVDLKNYLDHRNAAKFIEVNYNDGEEKMEAIKECSNSIHSLKHSKIPNILSDGNRHNFEILWRHDNGVDQKLHADYIEEMSLAFETGMKSLIDSHASKSVQRQLSPLVEEVTQHWMVARDRSQDFIGREEILEVINSYILSNDNKPLVLYGESGSGKTAIMAKAAAEAHKILDEDTLTIARFIGTTASSFDTRQIIYNICMQVAVCLGQNVDAIPNEYKELQACFFDMLANFPEDRNLVIFLDALQILVPQYNAHYLYWVPKNLQENVKLVLSTLPETHNILDRLRSEVIQSENNFIELPPMPLNECMDLLNLKLEQEKRCLHPDQQAIVHEAFRNCSYPLYVLLTLTEVRSWTSSVEPSDLPPAMKEFIHHIMDKLEVKHGRFLVSRALAYLTASTTGLSDCEMEDLLSLDDEVLNEIYGKSQHKIHRLPSISWIRLKKDIRDFLIEKENEGVTIYFWFHRMFMDIVKSRYLVDETSRKQIHSCLADYNLGIWHGKSKPYKRPTSANGKDVSESATRLVPSQPLTFQYKDGVTRYNKRKYEQVPRHLYLSGRLDELNSLVLFSYEFLYNKTKALSLEHILADFVLNPGVEATLVERALRDAQPYMEVNIDNMAPEITGRLLSYYSSHSNIRKLIQECDTAGLKHCALIPNFPYHQVPGSPLRYSIQCQRHPDHFALCGENSRFIVTKQASEQLVEIFDLATGEPSTEIHTSVGDMYLTPNGHYIVVVDHINEKSIKIHTSDEGKYLGQLIPQNKIRLEPKQKYKLSKLSLTDTFMCFTVTTGRSHLCIVDVEFCKFTEVIDLQGKSTVCQITPDSRYVFCNANETMLSYDLCTWEQTTNTALEYRPTQLVFTADVTKGFHINAHENKVYVMLIRDGYIEFMYKIPVEESFESDKVKELRVSNNQEMVLIIGKSNLLVYHITGEKIIAHFKRPTDIPVEFKLPRSHYQDITFTNADFSPDNKFVMATIFRNVYIWNIASNRLLTTLQAPVGIISDMQIPTDRGQIVTHLEGSNILHVWSLGDAIGHVGMLDRLTTSVQSVVMTANDKTAFVRCYGSDEIGVLDMKSGQLIDLLTHESTVVDYNITADGDYAIVALEDAKAGAFNKIWHIPGRRVIYEYGNVPAAIVPLETECTIISITQTQVRFKEPYQISQFKFRDGTFEEYQFDQMLPFVLCPPFITPEDKYLVVLSADDYDETNAHYVNPTICAVSLKANVDISTYSARDLRDIVQMRRILHIRPYANNSYTVIVIFTNEPDITDPADGRKSRGYDYSFGFMIYDIAAGVVVQVIDNFMSPQTPMDKVLFTEDVSLCIDHESNIFDMATGYYIKRLQTKEDCRPQKLALGGNVALYYDKCHLFALRFSDGKCIGHVNAHGQISCLQVCNDERTIVLGCEDGSLISYVLIDGNAENPNQVVPNILSRQSPLKSQKYSSLVRSWDKVDFENATNGPPYSRPPSAIIYGPTDRDMLKKVKPLSRPRSRERPVSDTMLYTGANSPQHSKACVVM